MSERMTLPIPKLFAKANYMLQLSSQRSKEERNFSMDRQCASSPLLASYCSFETLKLRDDKVFSILTSLVVWKKYCILAFLFWYLVAYTLSLLNLIPVYDSKCWTLKSIVMHPAL